MVTFASTQRRSSALRCSAQPRGAYSLSPTLIKASTALAMDSVIRGTTIWRVDALVTTSAERGAHETTARMWASLGAQIRTPRTCTFATVLNRSRKQVLYHGAFLILPAPVLIGGAAHRSGKTILRFGLA